MVRAKLSKVRFRLLLKNIGFGELSTVHIGL